MHRHRDGDKRTSQEVSLVQENKDNEGPSGGQRRLNLRDSSIGEQDVGDILEIESRR